jgi:hypothetical protein
MNGVWIVLGIGVAAVVAAIMQRHGRRHTDLGFVSHQWVTEHRLSQQHDRLR